VALTAGSEVEELADDAQATIDTAATSANKVNPLTVLETRLESESGPNRDIIFPCSNTSSLDWD
jgi:hypothetical protein